jgi:5-methyltetrahydropteroyltriglutamate--homocysteine methyltransferase
MNKLLPTTLVGSYAQPDWLIDRAKLAGPLSAARAREGTVARRAGVSRRRAGRRDLLAIRAQEQAGLDIITDGEMRRESYSNRFATALEGVDIDNPAPRSTAPAIPIRCRASTGKCGASIRWRCATSSSCAATPTA